MVDLGDRSGERKGQRLMVDLGDRSGEWRGQRLMVDWKTDRESGGGKDSWLTGGETWLIGRVEGAKTHG